MEAILKFGSDLYKVVVVEFNILRALIDSPYIDLPISQAKIIGCSSIEIPPNSKSLQNEGSLEACTDMYDSVLR